MSMSVVFLHGWGQSRQIWYQQMEYFADAVFLNLPGHGGSAEHDDWIKAMADQLPETPSIIVGWSLGGIIAMQLALKCPEKVKGLGLISTTPSFCNRNHWHHGCDQVTFHAFESGVKEASSKTMSRFFKLMFQGDSISRSEYNQIAKEGIDKTRLPTEATLNKGLDHLATTDLRESVSSIFMPTLVMHGVQDAIIPESAGRWLTGKLPNATWRLLDECGHAPFLAHAEIFNSELERWCQTI